MEIDWQKRSVEWMRLYEQEQAKVRMLREIQRELLDIICARGTVLRKAVEDAFEKRNGSLAPIPGGTAEVETSYGSDVEVAAPPKT